jgi:hypothetical protein
LGPGIPIAFPPDGLAGCAQTGAEKASTAATATPFTRSFMFMDLAPVVEQVGEDAEGTCIPIRTPRYSISAKM